MNVEQGSRPGGFGKIREGERESFGGGRRRGGGLVRGIRDMIGDEI
jgi:hypothetical protein